MGQTKIRSWIKEKLEIDRELKEMWNAGTRREKIIERCINTQEQNVRKK